MCQPSTVLASKSTDPKNASTCIKVQLESIDWENEAIITFSACN